MTAQQIAVKAAEIDDQNRRMTGLIVSLGLGAVAFVACTLIYVLY